MLWPAIRTTPTPINSGFTKPIRNKSKLEAIVAPAATQSNGFG